MSWWASRGPKYVRRGPCLLTCRVTYADGVSLIPGLLDPYQVRGTLLGVSLCSRHATNLQVQSLNKDREYFVRAMHVPASSHTVVNAAA